MRIIIDIGHPAHVHLFKNLGKIMKSKGHKVLFTCRDRENVIYLLSTYELDNISFGRHYNSLIGKIFGLFKNSVQLMLTSVKFRPDMFVSHGSTIASFISFAVRKPHIALEDTFNMEQLRLSLPFSDAILTGDYPHPSLGGKELRYPGYHELAYLHPNRFSPNKDALSCLDLEDDERYVIIRFVAWNATHDIGHKGLSLENKVRLVKELSKYLKVFISSEGILPEELKKYQIKIKPEQMHDILYYSSLFVGESGTMASECAVLGVPAIFLNNNRFGCIDDQEKYGLLYQFSESEKEQKRAIDKATELTQIDNIKAQYTERRDRMLKDKIDVTSFIVWFIENYPESANMMKQNDFSFKVF